jgi:signal transduction histidine kinase
MNAHRNIPLTVALSLLAILALLLLGHHYVLLPKQAAVENVRRSAFNELKSASAAFARLSDEFSSRSIQLSDSLSHLSGSELSLPADPFFDGISVYKNDSLLAWQGFAPLLDDSAAIVKDSGGSRFRKILNFSKSDSGEVYSLVTEKQLSQRDPLEILEYSSDFTHRLLGLEKPSAVIFDFTGVRSQNILAQASLITQQGDTAGIAFIEAPALSRYQAKLNKIGKSRSSLILWILILYLCLTGALIFSFTSIEVSLLIRHLLLYLFAILNIAGVFSLPGTIVESVALGASSVKALFFLVTLGLILLMHYELSKKSLGVLKTGLQTNLYVLLVILVLVLSLLLLPDAIDTVFEKDLPGIHQLTMLPDVSLLLFYLGCGVFALGWFRLLSVIRFTPLIRNPGWPDVLTHPRTFLIGCLIAAGGFYFLVNQSLEQKKNERIEAYKNEFLTSSVESAQNIIFELINSAYIYLSDLSEEDINNRPALVQQKLQQGSRVFFRPEWLEYSYDLRIIDRSGKLIAAYSSDLDTPAWTRVFDMSSLEIPYETERITRELNRPIVRSRPYNDLPVKYSTFRRAWIPIYEKDPESTKIIAWILCTLYKEPSKFEKPLRSLTAFSARPESRQDAVLISLYENGKLQRSRFFGFPGQLEHEERLPELIEKADTDSIQVVSETRNQNRLQEQFVRKGDDKWMRISRSLQSRDRHIFQITRFFLVLFIAGFVLSLPLSLAGLQSFKIFRKSRRFQHMLIDRVMYAIIICLFGLLLVSSEASEQQNRNRLFLNLQNQLENLADAMMLESQIQADEPSLERATFPLDLDASLFENGILVESTAPQMYNLALIPSVVPFGLYKQLQENGTSILIDELKLGGEDILIGYKKLPESNQIIAVPTFIRSPVYINLLLSNSAYLLGFYVIIFGLFIVASALIARQLTRPIEKVREALARAGEGSLDTTLPVISEDEIGSLSTAFNEMQSKLKKAREELSKAERDAAWKEMAQQVAHEIKNPLTPMKLSIQHLERKLQSGDYDPVQLGKEVHKLTTKIIAQINALDNIASDFSNFARPVERPFEEIVLNELMEELKALYGHYDEPEIEFIIPRKKINSFGVADDLRAALINLIKNAIEATSPEGIIKVKLGSRKGEALITIKDDGEGIPEELRDKIFNPNFSTKTSGTGLGLAISHKIILTHKGRITFSTKKNKGTTFYVYLPLSE